MNRQTPRAPGATSRMVVLKSGKRVGRWDFGVGCGPYRVIHNSICAFQLAMLDGAALLLPTILSFAILVLHLICALIKAVDEENYLKTVHGQAYVDYLARTGRLLPKL